MAYENTHRVPQESPPREFAQTSERTLLMFCADRAEAESRKSAIAKVTNLSKQGIMI